LTNNNDKDDSDQHTLAATDESFEGFNYIYIS